MNEIVKNTVLISGGAGSMGQLASDYINSRDDFILSAIYDPKYESQEYKSYNDLNDIKENLVIEFSPASVINENLENLLNSDADLIIGSSGVSSDMISKLKMIKDKKIIIIPNFSIGAAYQKIFSIALSKNFSSLNIIEKHHSKKQDAPSGTAIDLANALSSDLNSHKKDGVFYQSNVINNKNIHSLRGEEYIAEQVVEFRSEHESFKLEHKVDDRRAYLYGIKIVLDLFDELEGFNFGLENIIAKKINI